MVEGIGIVGVQPGAGKMREPGEAVEQQPAPGVPLGQVQHGAPAGAGEPVELGDDEGVAGAAGGEGLVQPGAFAAGAGRPWST